jgi:hypothetical protein
VADVDRGGVTRRSSSLVWIMARWWEGEPVLAKDQTTVGDADCPEEA